MTLSVYRGAPWVMVSTLLIAGPLSARDVQAQEPPSRAALLEQVLDEERSRLGVTGTGAAVVFPDGTLWSAGSGLAGPERPAEASTAFELGSVTKTYTAALVLLLVAEGRIDLHDPLARWHAEIAGAERITVRHLLNHTHGLHDPLQEPDYVPSVLQEPTRAWTLDDILTRMQAPLSEPGEAWRYSNTGFHLLGDIIEQVTDSTLDVVVRTRLLAPLGLTDTWYGPQDPEGASLAAAYIDPNGSGSPQPVSLLMPWTAFRTSAGPAGAMVSTAPDAARWLHALVTGRVLPPAQWEQMTSWVDRPDGNRYGSGLLRLEREQGPLIGHKGNSAGYSASLFHEPATGLTVAVLTNAHAIDVTPVVLALLEAASGPERDRP
jgi:D-alanyl-D-alanine carboxypeptidase